ncbi:hypothetical protein WJX75_002580 [Coccomyxa subellipsoidea]|uniref:Protein kinase domain-containing protein n=1 Tax=Coccomyxa subellipsoidea TaxID=248742 RepID=A0ABR2Z2W4_9CHLO
MAEPQKPHPIDGSYSDIELAPFSSDYEQMRHHKGIIGEGAFGRVEHVLRVGGAFGRWCAKYIKVSSKMDIALAQHELQMLHWQKDLPGGVRVAENSVLFFADTCGEAHKHYWGTETFMSPELLENRLQRQRREDMSTDVNPQSTDIYANGVMLTILLRSALRQEAYEPYLFEPPYWNERLSETQRADAHLASYRRARQYLDEKYSLLAFMSSFRVPLDCQDFLLQQLAPQESRATAAEIASHPFLLRMAARRQAANEVKDAAQAAAC